MAVLSDSRDIAFSVLSFGSSKLLEVRLFRLVLIAASAIANHDVVLGVRVQ